MLILISPQEVEELQLELKTLYC